MQISLQLLRVVYQINFIYLGSPMAALLYADDVALYAPSVDGLQLLLDKCFSYLLPAFPQIFLSHIF